ncbi:MAG: hypothetical protein WCO79_03180 [bacterium]
MNQFRINVSIAIFVAVCATLPIHLRAASTQPLPIDFVRNQIWFSKQPFVGGEQVKVYTSVFNGSTANARGTVEFYDNQTQIGATQFSAPAGGSQIVSIRWTASSGDHLFRAKITSIRATYPDGKEEVLPDITTGATVSVKVAAPVPPPSAATASTPVSLSGVLRSFNTSPATGTSTLPQQVIHGLVVAASSTDSLIDRVHAALEVKKVANDKQIALSKSAPLAKTGSKTSLTAAAAGSQTGVDGSVSPFRILYSYLLHFLAWVSNYKVAVYILAIYLIYKIPKILFRRFSRREV